MKNTYKLVWSDEARYNLIQIITYLEQNWTIKEIKKFTVLLDKQLSRIQNYPFLFPESDKNKNFRKSVLSKQISIYYRVNNFDIQIYALFDNRQNPSKLNKL